MLDGQLTVLIGRIGRAMPRTYAQHWRGTSRAFVLPEPL